MGIYVYNVYVPYVLSHVVTYFIIVSTADLDLWVEITYLALPLVKSILIALIYVPIDIMHTYHDITIHIDLTRCLVYYVLLHPILILLLLNKLFKCVHKLVRSSLVVRHKIKKQFVMIMWTREISLHKNNKYDHYT